MFDGFQNRLPERTGIEIDGGNALKSSKLAREPVEGLGLNHKPSRKRALSAETDVLQIE